MEIIPPLNPGAVGQVGSVVLLSTMCVSHSQDCKITDGQVLDFCYGPTPSYVKVPSRSNVTIGGDRAFKEVIKMRSLGGSYHSINGVFLRRGD